MDRISTLADLRQQYPHDDRALEGAAHAARDEHTERMRHIHANASNGTLSASEQRDWDAHERAWTELDEFINEQRANRVAQSRASHGSHKMSNGSDSGTAPATGVRAQALRLLDTEHAEANTRQRLDELIRADRDDLDGDLIAQRTILTMNPDYRSGFARKMTEPDPLLTNREIEAIRAVQQFERRTMQIGNDGMGGFAVPVVIDPTFFLTGQGSRNPFMDMARVETITTDTWRGITTPGTTWQWRAELDETTDNSPTLSRPEIPAEMADGYIPFSIEAQGDIVNFESQLQRLLAEGYSELLVEALTTGAGSGSNQPRGIVTALDANTNVEVAVSTAGEIGGADVRGLWSNLPARARNSMNAMWISSVGVREHIRRLAADPNGVGEGDPTFSLDDGLLLDRPYRVAEYMDDYATGTGSQNWLAVGDFSGFVIALRAGMSVELIPHVMGTNNRPIGARALYGWARAGSDSIDDLRFRVLQNASS